MPPHSVHLKIKITVSVVRRGVSKRSHEKIGDCEQSSVLANKVFKTGLKIVDLLTMNVSPFKDTTIYPLRVLAICLPEVVKYL